MPSDNSAYIFDPLKDTEIVKLATIGAVNCVRSRKLPPEEALSFYERLNTIEGGNANDEILPEYSHLTESQLDQRIVEIACQFVVAWLEELAPQLKTQTNQFLAQKGRSV